MLYRIISCCLIILIPYVLLAQQSSTDHVYTKKGSLFVGEIIEYRQGDALELRLKNGSIVVIAEKEIKKIVQEQDEVKAIKSHKPYAFRERGWYGWVNGQVNTSDSAFESSSTVGLGLHGVVGYQWNRRLGTGLGVGMDYYYLGSAENILPVYVEVRSFLNEKNTAPFVSLQGGYGFAFVDEERGMESAKGGFMWHPAIGLRCGASSSTNFTIDLGVKIQYANYRFQEWDVINEHDMTYRRVVLRFGVLF